MSDREGIERIFEEIQYLCAKRERLAETIPRLIVVHGHHQAVTDCLPGETIEQVQFSVRTDMISLPLSPTGLVIADVVARKKPMALTAAHIERILASDPFYLRLGANAATAQRAVKRPTRKTIKVFVQRLRREIGTVLKQAGLAIRPEEVLVSEDTDLLNVKAYRLAIPCEFVHLRGTSGRT